MVGFVYLIGSGINVGDTALGMLGMAFSETIGLVGRPSLMVKSTFLTSPELKKGTRKCRVVCLASASSWVRASLQAVAVLH